MAGIGLSGCNTTIAVDRTVVSEPVRMTGNWQIDEQTDRILGERKRVAKLLSFRAHQDGRRRAAAAAGLMISCASGAPFVAMLFAGNVSTRKNAVLSYRIDDNPGKTMTVDSLADRKGIAVTDPGQVDDFLRQLGPSSVLLVRIHSPRVGISEAEFSTAGADEAIDSAAGNCWRRETESEA